VTTTELPTEGEILAAVDAPSEDRLTSRAATLRPRASVPVDRWFQLAGAVFIAVGLLAIIAGWYGVSHTARQWRQTPYLMSGGVLGLGLIFIGGFSYFAFWMTKLVQQTHRQTAVLERIERAMTGATGDASDSDRLVIVPPGIVHRAACPLVVGKADVRPLGEVQAGMQACPLCSPELPEPRPAPASRSRK
jgi:hypothetical protein